MTADKQNVIKHSAIYRGQIRHRRHRDGLHAFTYPIAMLYIDLDELPTLFTDVPFWSYRRPAIGWFREADYLANEKGDTLRQRVNHAVFNATGKYPAGPVRLLAHPRYFGFGMNPISCFYCYKADGATLQYMVAEVTNTPWRERIAYVIPCESGEKQHNVRFEKRMHVSPFNPMEMHYLARFNAPGKKLYLHLENHANFPVARDSTVVKDSTVVTDATLTLVQEPLSSRSLVQLLWQFPLMTMQVAAGIYWQALRLWLHGARFHHHTSIRSLNLPTQNATSTCKEIQP